MSKGLCEKIKKECGYLNFTNDILNLMKQHKIPDVITLENELKRLENYEQNEDFNRDVLNYAYLSEKDKIKKLKALEIIKRCPTEICNLIDIYDSWEEYKDDHRRKDERWIKDKEEFDLLREVLE